MSTTGCKRTLSWVTVLTLLVAFGVPQAYASPKKITVQGVLRRAGTSGSDALINTTGAAVTLTLRCTSGSNGCPGATSSADYSVSSTGLVGAGTDSTVTVRNGAFSVSITPTSTTLQDMVRYKDAAWSVVIDGQLDPYAPSDTLNFPIALESVPFASVADWSAAALSADQIKGVTVDVSNISSADGYVLKLQSGQFVLAAESGGGGGGGGGGSYSAGSGLTLSGTTFNVDSGTTTGKVPLVGAGNKLATSLIDTGTGNGQIPILDGSGKLATSVLPTIPMSNLNLNATTGLVQYVGGMIPSGTVNASSLTANSVNSTHIADGTIASADIGVGEVAAVNIATASIGTTKIIDSAVTDAKIAGVSGSKISGSISLGATDDISARDFNAGRNVTVANQGELRMKESGGNNYIGLRAPAALSADYTWTLPSGNGTDGQVLKFNAGTSEFYWANDAGAAGGVSGPGSSTTNALARWADASGTSLINSGVTIDGSNNIAGVVTLNAASVNVSGATASRFALFDSSRNLISSASTVNDTEFGYLSGASANIQTQLNAKIGLTDIAGKLDKIGGSLSGALNSNSAITTSGTVTANAVNVSGATNASRFVLLDSSKNLISSTSTVSDTEFGYLSGASAGIQTQINSLLSSVATDATTLAGKLDKIGGSLSGALNSGAAITSTGTITGNALNLSGASSASRFVLLDASRNLVSSASSVSDTEFGYLTGASANIQTQINSLLAGGGTAGKLDKAGDSMTGNLTLLNQKELRLAEASGGGSNFIALRAPSALAADLTWTLPNASGGDGQLLKFNAGTSEFYWANDAGAAGGVSGPGATTATNTIPRWTDASGTSITSSGITIDNSNNILGAANVSITGATVSGLTASRVMLTDANRALSSSSNIDGTELGYLDNVSANVQTQINSLLTSVATNTGDLTGKLDKIGGSLSGALNSGAAITSTGTITGNAVNVSGASNASRFVLLDSSKNLVSSASTVSDTEFGYLLGASANIQTQINSLLAGGGTAGKLDKVGGTMTGGLGLDYSGASASGVVVTDSDRLLKTSTVVSLTELNYLDNVTAGIQGQIDTLSTAVGSASGNLSAKLDKIGGSLSGALNSNSAITTSGTVTANAVNVSGATNASRFVLLDGSRNLVSSASTVSDTEFGYLTGASAGIQTQINTINTALGLKLVAADIVGKLDKAGDSMTGNLTLLNQKELHLAEASGNGSNYIALRAPSALAADLTWTLPTANGGDGQLLKFNAGTSEFYWANDAGAAGGVTGPGAVTSTNALPRWSDASGTSIISSGVTIDNSNNILGAANLSITGATVSGLTASRVMLTDANRALSSSSNIDGTELGYLDNVSANVQTQINSLLTSVATASGDLTGKLDKIGGSLSGALNSGAAITSTGTITGNALNVSGQTPSRFTMFDGSRNLISSTNAVSDTEFGYLLGASANLQTQINSLLAGGGTSGKLDKVGGTMTGGLGLDYSGASASGVVVTDSDRLLKTSTVVSLTELSYLDGVTSALDVKVNRFTATEAGYIAGVTAGIQGQIDTLSTAVGSASGNLSAKLDKIGGSLSGALNSGAAITSTGTITGNAVNVSGASNASRFVLLDGSRNLVSSASAVSDTEFGYLAGASAGIQTQINTINTALGLKLVAADIVGKLDKAGDSMTGNLTLLNQKELRLAEASGGGSNFIALRAPSALAADLTWTLPNASGGDGQLLKFNAGTSEFYWANDAGAAGGVTGPGATTATNTIPRWTDASGTSITSSGITIDNSNNILGAANLSITGATVSGLTASRVMLTDANRALSSSSNIDGTELGYLDNVSANVQTQINSILSSVATDGTNIAGKLDKIGGSLSGALNSGAAITSTGTITGNAVNVSGASSGSRFAMLDGSKNIVSSASTVSDTEFGYLTGASANVQGQINSLLAGGGTTGKVDRTGDTMTGSFGLNYTNVTPNRVAYVDANRILRTDANVDSTELGYLDNVSANVQTQINSLLAGGGASTKIDQGGGTMTGALGLAYGTAAASGVVVTNASRQLITSTTVDLTELGYLDAVTAGIQGQINTLSTSVATDGTNIAGKLDKIGGSLSGVLNSNSAITTSGTVTANAVNVSGATSGSRFAMLDGSKNVVSSASTTSDTEFGYLAGTTAAVQTQINALLAGGGASTKIDQGGGTMTGALGLAYGTAAASGVVVTNASRQLITSTTVDLTELGYLDGVTSSLQKTNSFTATEATYLSGTTASIQTQLNAKLGSLGAGSVTSTNLLGTTNSEAVTFDKLRTTDSNGESHANNTLRVVADRVYGTGSTEGTDKITLPSIVRIPLSVAHTDCGVVDNGSNDLVVCAGF